MAQEFSFTISATPHPKAAEAVIKDPQQLLVINQNLQLDSIWGWCVPRVTTTFDVFTGTSELDRGSYPSQAAFLTSPDYLQLQELAILDIHNKLSFAQKLFHQRVNAFYEAQGEPFQNPQYRLILFD